MRCPHAPACVSAVQSKAVDLDAAMSSARPREAAFTNISTAGVDGAAPTLTEAKQLRASIRVRAATGSKVCSADAVFLSVCVESCRQAVAMRVSAL